MNTREFPIAPGVRSRRGRGLVREFPRTAPATAAAGGPERTGSGYAGAVVTSELEPVEALELLGMTLAHLNDAEASGEVSARIPLLMAIRDKLAAALREDL